MDSTDVCFIITATSVVSFLVLGGGGGQDPQMYRQEKK